MPDALLSLMFDLKLTNLQMFLATIQKVSRMLKVHCAYGKNPWLLYGYGGYGISLTPEARYWLRMWIDQGGIYAEATLRGGGEFGEDWHRAGKLTKKQNVSTTSPHVARGSSSRSIHSH